MRTQDRKHNFLQLIEVFTVRELASRYRLSILGPLWLVLYPLLTALFLNFVFGIFLKIKTNDIPYYLYVFSGLVIWNYFEQGLRLSVQSFVWNRELCTKNAFEIMTLPISFVLSKIPDFIVEFVILVLLIIVNGQTLHGGALLVPLLLIPLVMTTIGIALVVSLANAVFRDFGKLVDFVLMLCFYAVPLLYSETLIPSRYSYILHNPLSITVMSMRSLVFGGTLNLFSYLEACLMSAGILICGLMVFNKHKRKFIDLI